MNLRGVPHTKSPRRCWVFDSDAGENRVCISDSSSSLSWNHFQGPIS